MGNAQDIIHGKLAQGWLATLGALPEICPTPFARSVVTLGLQSPFQFKWNGRGLGFLAAHEVAQQRRGKRIATVPVLVDQSVFGQFGQNLVHMAGAEWFLQNLPGFLDHLLRRKLVITRG